MNLFHWELLFVIALFTDVLLIDVVSGLSCWHCIADNCELNPSENYKASKTECQPNQCCQKVIFEMFSTTDKTIYTSTIRSCAGECDSYNDFKNCTDELYTTTGCVTKTCCVNEDFCNSASFFGDSSACLVCSLVAFVVNAMMVS